MIYRFTIISDEVDDFLREIQIDPEATFYDFHKAILASCGYADDQMTSFFICSDDWEKEQEITLEEMDSYAEDESYVMNETPISDLVEDAKQKLIYIFDYMTERCFFMEMKEIITGKTLLDPLCQRKEGKAPKQFVDIDQFKPVIAAGSTDLDDEIGEEFYGSDAYNDDELTDLEGFDDEM